MAEESTTDGGLGPAGAPRQAPIDQGSFEARHHEPRQQPAAAPDLHVKARPPGSPAPDQHRRMGGLVANSLLAAVIASQLMVLLHELAHLVTGTACGFPGRLYPFAFVPKQQPPAEIAALEAIAAPIFSLVTGAIMIAWQPLRKATGFWHLAWIWFAFTSFMEGVAYFVITPLGAGDTAVFAEKLALPVWVQLLMSAAGIGGMLLAARLMAGVVQRHIGFDDKKGSWALVFWPWLIATAITVALSVLFMLISDVALAPGEVIAVAMVGTVLFVAGPMSFIFAKAVRRQPIEGLHVSAFTPSAAAALVLILAAAFVLTSGPSIAG